jgi:DNA-directed RNA polymerase specialized sigma24 family protein
MAMARFLVLPGASRLLQAFGAIPPGILRDSVIAHAEAIATTYLGAPIGQQMPDPIRAMAPAASAALPPAQEPNTDSLESEIIKLRLAGKLPKDIAKKLKIDVQKVYQAAYEARKAGIELPNTRKLLKGKKTKTPWHVRLEDVSGQGRVQIGYAATKRGITPEAYLERRQIALRLALENAPWEEILKATGEQDPKVVSAWLSNARTAGYPVPYITAADNPERRNAGTAWTRPEAAPAPEPPPQQPEIANGPHKPVFLPLSELSPRAYAAILAASKRRNLTIHAYTELRESIIAHRMRGLTPTEIANVTGEPLHFVKDALASAKDVYGAVFPPFGRQEMEAA